MAKRYVEEPVEDRSGLDQDYAEAMRAVHKQFPQNNDIACFLAEALMDLHPWDLWKKSGEIQPWTGEIVALLEAILRRNPNHPQANHLYIHATEASKSPEAAIKSAERLLSLVPGSGHLVHMPSHTYIRTGDYHKGSIANEKAIKADSSYIAKCHAQGIYPLAYYPHNYHFLSATAALEGRGQVSMNAAFEMAKGIDQELMVEDGYGTLQHYFMVPYLVMVKFAQWDRILSEKKPPSDEPFPVTMWHYARGMAYAGNGSLEKATSALQKMEEAAKDPVIKTLTVWDINPLEDVVNIGKKILQADIARRKGQFAEAIDLLEEAVAIEDQQNYNEPPDWFFSVRHTLGSVLMEAGRYAEAEKVYREDLLTFPKERLGSEWTISITQKPGKSF